MTTQTVGALLGLAARAIGIAERELAFIAGGGLEIQDAPREAVGNGVRHALALAVNMFAADAEEGEGGTPGGGADFAEADFDGGVAVSVAIDLPLETEVVEGGVFDDEAAGADGVLGLERGGE